MHGATDPGVTRRESRRGVARGPWRLAASADGRQAERALALAAFYDETSVPEELFLTVSAESFMGRPHAGGLSNGRSPCCCSIRQGPSAVERALASLAEHGLIRARGPPLWRRAVFLDP